MSELVRSPDFELLFGMQTQEDMFTVQPRDAPPRLWGGGGSAHVTSVLV